MQFITVFNQFWRIRQDEYLTSSEVNLFFTILHCINNARGEDNELLKVEVAIGNPKMELLSGIPTRSISRIRNSLKQKGYIDFKSGKGKGHYAIYKLGEKFHNLVTTSQVNDQVKSNLVSHDQLNDQVNDQVSDQVNDQVNDQRIKNIEYRDQSIENNKNTNPPIIPPKGGKASRQVVEDIFQYYKLKSGKNFRLTDKLIKKCKQRLRTFSPDEIKRAIDNLLVDNFMTGDNDRGKFYATFEYLVRNDENVDKWLNSTSAKPKTKMEKELEMIANFARQEGGEIDDDFSDFFKSDDDT